MNAAPFDGRAVSDGDGQGDFNISYQPLTPVRAIGQRSARSESPHHHAPVAAARDDISASQPARSSSASSAARRESIRPSTALSLTQPNPNDGATSLASPHTATRIDDALRKRKRPSHVPPTASSSSVAAATASPYDWLFEASPHLFASSTVLRSGVRPFEWLNTVDDTSPLTYLHSSDNIVHPSAKAEEAPYDNADDDCCDCRDSTQCMGGSCSCTQHRPQDAMHTRDGLRGANGSLPPPLDAWITECNKNCKCAQWRSRRCLNRVVQSAPVNPAHRLLVFHTGERGWGALALTRIPAWQYVCEYIGEVISDSLAESRTDKYLFSLDPKLITGGRWEFPSCFEPPILDATQVGHVARFVNHSCAPNCKVYQVLTDGRDPLKFRLALFSCQDVEAGEELTINYAYTEKDKLRLFGGPCKCDQCVGRDGESGEEREQGRGRSASVGGRGAENGSSKKRAMNGSH